MIFPLTHVQSHLLLYFKLMEYYEHEISRNALDPPTKGMLSEAASAGRFQLPGLTKTYPKVQIFTVEDFFDGKRPDLPDVSDTLKKAKRITKSQTKPELGI